MMKKASASIFVLVALISFSGCMTTAYRGEEKVSPKIPAAAKVSSKIPAAAFVTPQPIFFKVLTERPAIISATPARTEAGGFWDLLDDKSVQDVVTVIDKAKVKLSGWACNIEKGTVPQDVYLEFEGPVHAYLKVTTRLKRPDVVAYYKKPGLMDSGWVVFADLTALPSGTYKVEIFQIEGKAGLFDETGRSFKFINSNLKSKK